MSSGYLLQTENLNLQWEGRQILRRVHVAVAPKQVFALPGRKGSGKSSLAYTLMGCASYAAQEGRILFAGQDITPLPMTGRARLGLTLAWQEPGPFEGLKVRGYLALTMQEPCQEQMEEALEAVALSPSAYLSRPVNETLCSGERKRIELAAVYAMRPMSRPCEVTEAVEEARAYERF